MSRMLLRRAGLAALALALPLAACGSVGPQPAATVEGTSISEASLRDEIAAIRSNAEYQAALENSYGGRLDGAGKGTFARAFATQVLSLRIYYVLLERELDLQGASVGSSDLKDAAVVVQRQFDSLEGGVGPAVLRAFSPEYRKRLTREQALIAVADQLQQGKQETPAEYYTANRARFEEACTSHILIGLDDRSKAEAKSRAERVKAQLDGGANFAFMANGFSDDPQNAAEGGDLGCGARGRFVAAFDEAAFDAPIGAVVGPVETQFGYHLILVRSRRVPPLAEVESQIEQQLASEGGDALNDFLAKVTCDPDVDVEISSRYGRWDRSPCAGGGFARVLAPEGPTTTTSE